MGRRVGGASWMPRLAGATAAWGLTAAGAASSASADTDPELVACTEEVFVAGGDADLAETVCGETAGATRFERALSGPVQREIEAPREDGRTEGATGAGALRLHFSFEWSRRDEHRVTRAVLGPVPAWESHVWGSAVESVEWVVWLTWDAGPMLHAATRGFASPSRSMGHGR